MDTRNNIEFPEKQRAQQQEKEADTSGDVEKAKQWQWGDELEPSPLMVNSFLNKGPQKAYKFPIIQFDLSIVKGPKQG